MKEGHDMAKKKSFGNSKDKDNQEQLHCEDCELAYDYHEKDYKGEFFLCKCPYFKFSRFLRRDSCDKLIPKKKKVDIKK